MMDKIREAIEEAMENRTAFTVGGISVSESVVVTWIIMAVLVIVSIIFTRNLKLVPDRKQMIIESFVGFLRNFFREQLGDKGMKYFPYLATVMLYIGLANIIGLFGLTPPTKDLNVTAALALMSIVLVEASGIRAKGTKGWLKGFAQPVAFMVPMNLMEVITRPLSLCMRLFGNVLAAYIIMEMIIAIVPIALPLAFSAYFDIFDGFLQAYVFVFLTSLYINEAIEDD